MAGGGVLQDAGGRIDDRVTDGREVCRRAASEKAVQALEQLARPRRVVGESGERRSDLPHCGGGSEPVADDVSHRQSDPTVRQLEGVVPVTSDLEHVAAGLVQRRHGDIGAIDEARGEECSLQPDRDLPFLGFQRSKSVFGLDPLRDVDPRRVQETHHARFVHDRMHHEIDDALAAVRHPVGQRLAEDLARRSLLRREADAPLHIVGAAPPRRVPERQVEHLVAAVPTRLDGERVDIADVAFRVQDAGEDPGLVEDRLELRVCRGERLIRFLARGDVANDLRGADDPPGLVPDRRDRERHVEPPPVLCRAGPSRSGRCTRPGGAGRGSRPPRLAARPGSAA